MIAVALETKLLIAYVGVLFLACFSGGLTAIFLENDILGTNSESVSAIFTDSLRASLEIRMDSLLQTAGALFKRLDGDVSYQRTYAVSVFNDTLPVVRYNKNFFVMDYPTIAPPDVDLSGRSEHYSFWYRSNQQNLSLSIYLNKSSLLDDSHGPFVRVNSAYAGLYMGFEDNLLRHLPYLAVGPALDDHEYLCLSNGEMVATFIPSCRTWYIKAKANPVGTQFTSPYKDANTGAVMISLAQAVVVNDIFIGVVAADVTLFSLETVVRAATVLESGYTYICDIEKQLIVHPRITDPNVLYVVSELEFSPTETEEIRRFNMFLDTYVLTGGFGHSSFMKGGATWFVTYGPIAGTPYFMLMVVPEDEVIAPGVAVQTYADTSTIYLIFTAACIGSFVLVAGSFIANTISKKITEPVIMFTEILSNIAAHRLGDHEDSGDSVTGGVGGGATTGELTEIHSLRNKISDLFLAVKFSTDAYYKSDYQSALVFLQQVEDMFKMMGQRRALGVIYNNRGNILRKHGGEQDKFAAALGYLEMAVAIIRIDCNNVSEELAKAKEAALQAFRGNNYRVVSSADIRILSEQEAIFEKVLALRLSNYGDCFREAHRYSEADAALSESFRLFEKHNEVLGMLQAKGNQGVLRLDQGDIEGAEAEFQSSLKMAQSNFEKDMSYATVAGVQFASMNMGSYHYKCAKLEEMGSYARKHQVERALSLFYFALTICDRVHRAVQTQCLFTLAEIFKHEYDKEGADAASSLCKMYPQFAKEIAFIGGVTNVNFLVDTSSSMIGPSISAVVGVLHDIVNNKLKFGDKLSIDSFARELVTVVQPTTLDVNTIGYVNSSIQSLATSCVPGVVDGTYCFKALIELGRRLVAENKNGPHFIVVLTDGKDNERRTTAAQAKGFFTENNIKLIIVSCVKDPAIVKNLRYLATSNDFYIQAADPQSIADAVQKGFELAVSVGNVVMEAL